MQIFGCFFENYNDFIAIMRDFHLSSFSGRYYRPLFSLPSVRRPPFASAKIGGSGGASVPLFPLPSPFLLQGKVGEISYQSRTRAK